ncbi:MAG: IS110 family transposase [Bryobacteraceae bacterium]
MDRKLGQIDKHLAKQLQPHADLILRLCTIPGADFTTAALILSEIGFEMSRFPDPAHLASSLHQQSAGKCYSGCTCKRNRYLRRILTQSSWSVMRKKDCYLKRAVSACIRNAVARRRRSRSRIGCRLMKRPRADRFSGNGQQALDPYGLSFWRLFVSP